MENISGFELVMIIIFASIVGFGLPAALATMFDGGPARGSGSWPPLPTPGKAGKTENREVTIDNDSNQRNFQPVESIKKKRNGRKKHLYSKHKGGGRGRWN
jgi:hypothetical protein